MSLEKFLGKSKSYTINGEELVLKPLSVKEMDSILAIGNAKGEPEPEKLRDFVIKVLENSYPNEDVGQVSVVNMQELLEACMDVHGFETDNKSPN